MPFSFLYRLKHEEFKISKKNVISGLIIALGLILVILALSAKVASEGHNNAVPKVTPTAKEADPDPIIYTAGSSSESQTVFDILKTLSQERNFELKYSNDPRYGVFVESIAGVKNGTNNKYWQYYVNDKLGEVAADKKEVKAGDKVEWRFEKVPEF